MKSESYAYGLYQIIINYPKANSPSPILNFQFASPRQALPSAPHATASYQ